MQAFALIRERLSRRILTGIAAATSGAFLLANPRAIAAELVIQAFDKPFHSVGALLPSFKSWGATHILISPPQKSADTPEWWGRYQPLDYEKIEGPLGNEAELRSLGEAATQEDLGLLVDTVLNHMADTKYAPNYSYSQFDANDFHFAQDRRCIQNYGDRTQATTYWLCDWRSSLPDLKTEDAKVRSVHLHYLKKLAELGVTGFRFDAAVNIETDYFSFMSQQLRSLPAYTSNTPLEKSNRSLFMFAEVVGTQLDEAKLYTGFFPITDFFLLKRMIHAFSSAGELQILKWDALKNESLPEAQRGPFSSGTYSPMGFVRTHDAIDNEDFFHFYATEDEDLAFAYLIGRGGNGTILILDRDLERLSVQTALRYRLYFDSQIPRAQFDALTCDNCESANILVWKNEVNTSMDDSDTGSHPPDHLPEQGTAKAGLVIINKSTAWVDLNALHIKLGGSLAAPKRSCYQEVQHHFMACFAGKAGESELEVVQWADQRADCSLGAATCLIAPKIGPRTALLFTKVP